MTAYAKNCSRCSRDNHCGHVYKSQSRKVSRDGKREKCRAAHEMCQFAEITKHTTQELDTILSKIFNLHSIISVIIAKLKAKLIKEQKHVNIK